MKNRKLKVRSGYYDYQISKYYVPPPPVPFILIKGYWLEGINFNIGQTANVEVSDKRLILTTELN